MKKYSSEQIQEVLKKKEYSFFSKGAYNINIIGIRKTYKPELDKFDDILVVIYNNHKGFEEIKYFPITTETGKHYLNNPMNDGGTAILVPNQYKGSYSIGTHNGVYEALIQTGAVKVWRDNNKDDILDYTGKESKGYYGINIHRANSLYNSPNVGYYSAGCQVFENSDNFKGFMNICRTSKQYYGNKFTYTLIEERDFA